MRLFAIIITSLLLPALIATAEDRPARRIALLSDPHISVDPKLVAYAENFQRVIEQVNAAHVDAVLLAGDLTQGGDVESLRKFAVMVKQLKAPAWWVPGNHDIGQKRSPENTAMVTARRLMQFDQNLGSASYAVNVLPDIRVVSIASSLIDSGLPAEQAQWAMLEHELAMPSTARTLLLTHYPPFVERPDEADGYFNMNTAGRQRLFSLLQQHPITAILAGHLHRAVQTQIGSVPLIIGPAISFGLPRWKTDIGWTLITIDSAGRIQADNQWLPASATTQPIH